MLLCVPASEPGGPETSFLNNNYLGGEIGGAPRAPAVLVLQSQRIRKFEYLIQVWVTHQRRTVSHCTSALRTGWRSGGRRKRVHKRARGDNSLARGRRRRRLRRIQVCGRLGRNVPCMHARTPTHTHARTHTREHSHTDRNPPASFNCVRCMCAQS